MSGPTRRGFVRVTGAALGGVAGATGRADARGEDGRYVVDTRTVSVERLRASGLEVVHDIHQLDLAAVRGPRSALDRLGADYRTDGQFGGGFGSVAPEPRRDVAQPETRAERRGVQSPVDAPFYPLQWDKQAFDVAAVHDLTRGEGARVAILDSGVHAVHPDLRNAVNLELSRNFTDDGYGVGRAYAGDHGTICGGVVAADGTWLSGTAPAAELVDCRVFDAGGGGAYETDYLMALAYSADIGCDVANLSLGPTFRTPLQYALYSRPTHARAIQYAARRGMVVVVAAGNDAIDLDRYGLIRFTPSPATMVVSATGPLGYGWPTADDDRDGSINVAELEDPIDLEAPVHEPALYSNRGSDLLSVSAPGGNYDSVAAATDEFAWELDMLPVDRVAVTVDEAGELQFREFVGFDAGTSFAAPQVAAVVALVRSVVPDLPPAEVRAVIERTAATVDGASPSRDHGAGFLDPLAAVRTVL